MNGLSYAFLVSSLKIKNRISVMRSAVLHGRLWDDLYIGFQNHISRDPDIYHHKFWNHFQTELPVSAPDWDAFLQQAEMGSSFELM
ncbi:hypothetical protein CesoFtcFv8_026287 [Champsocephalus esox]|uniref:Uncharacterized protein n=1 Tax=Champsocephalus esox TaxID=159716 RepID=A0AAN8B2M2_9TELE|nr:hypothetical protein CesoFtcFv8_026287 [Champsocephalus esox]